MNIQFKAKVWLQGLLVLLMFSAGSSAHAAVWQAKNQWSMAWETKYQEWVAENMTTDFFMNPKKPVYYRMAHDCADSIYFMRMAFAYENKLPFSINNIMQKGKLLSNNMRNWDRENPVNRVRKFMQYVADRVGTRSLHLDTYPVALADIGTGWHVSRTTWIAGLRFTGALSCCGDRACACLSVFGGRAVRSRSCHSFIRRCRWRKRQLTLASLAAHERARRARVYPRASAAARRWAP